jgi:hypothetical protein
LQEERREDRSSDSVFLAAFLMPWEVETIEFSLRLPLLWNETGGAGSSSRF